MSYRGLGYNTDCKIVQRFFDSSSGAADGKECPPGKIIYSDGTREPCKEYISCVTKDELDRIHAGGGTVNVPPPKTTPVDLDSFWNSYREIIVGTAVVVGLLYCFSRSGGLPCPTAASGSWTTRRRSLPPMPLT